MVTIKFLLASILITIPGALAGTPDKAIKAIRNPAKLTSSNERRQETGLCRPVTDPKEVAAIVNVFDDDWLDTKALNSVMTLPAEECITRSFGKSIQVTWTYNDALGKYY